jgi:hypothetical protein
MDPWSPTLFFFLHGSVVPNLLAIVDKRKGIGGKVFLIGLEMKVKNKKLNRWWLKEDS